MPEHLSASAAAAKPSALPPGDPDSRLRLRSDARPGPGRGARPWPADPGRRRRLARRHRDGGTRGRRRRPAASRQSRQRRGADDRHARAQRAGIHPRAHHGRRRPASGARDSDPAHGRRRVARRPSSSASAVAAIRRWRASTSSAIASRISACGAPPACRCRTRSRVSACIRSRRCCVCQSKANISSTNRRRSSSRRGPRCRFARCPVDVYYPPVAERRSHYRKVVDTLRIIRAVAPLLVRR